MNALEYASAHQERFVEELLELLRVPSVSAFSEHRGDVARAAAMLATGLERSGMEHVEVVPTAGHPQVVADWLHAPGRPTVLCYGHYDVQPAAQEDGWSAPPFEPVLRGGDVIARGASDDKGQVLIHMKALESLLVAEGRLPVNVRVVLEGEEESGGDSLERFMAEDPGRLACDAVLVSDTAMFAPGVPTVTVGLRGLCYVELAASGPARDLHSGGYGGAAPNPLFSLAQLVGALKDADGRIQVPGFYDRVVPPGAAELAGWAALPFDEEAYRRDEVGARALAGEPGYPVLVRTWARPTLDVHGMPGGFTGPGAKTVIPARASAKVSMRLVPDQDPAEILRLFSAHVAALVPRGIELEVRSLGLAEPVLVDPDGPFVAAARRALGEVWGREAVTVRSGGSIPVVTAFRRHLGAPSVLMGFALPGDGAHGPDEKFAVASLQRGIHAVIRFLETLAGSLPRGAGVR